MQRNGAITLSNFRVSYLSSAVENATAVEDDSASGYFRHESVVVAVDERAVVAELRSRGCIPLSVESVKPVHPFFNRVSRDYKLQFLQALGFNIEAGMSAGKALQTVIESESGPVRERLNYALNILRSGGGFHEAVAAMDFFDETTLAILESGERTGKMKDAVKTSVEHYQSRSSSLKVMLGAVTFTMLDLVFAVASIFGNRFSLLPMIKEGGFKAENPAAAEKFNRILDLCYWVNDILLVSTLLLCVALVGIGWAYVGKNMAVRTWVDNKLMTMPAMKDALLHSAVASTAMIASSLLRGGVPFATAVQIAARGTRMPTVQAYWQTAYDRLVTGESVARAMNQPILENSERIIITAHNNQNQLGEALTVISSRREDLSKAAAKKFSILAFIASLFYSGIATLFTLWVVYLQNAQMMAATGSMG